MKWNECIEEGSGCFTTVAITVAYVKILVQFTNLFQNGKPVIHTAGVPFLSMTAQTDCGVVPHAVRYSYVYGESITEWCRRLQL